MSNPPHSIEMRARLISQTYDGVNICSLSAVDQNLVGFIRAFQCNRLLVVTAYNHVGAADIDPQRLKRLNQDRALRRCDGDSPGASLPGFAQELLCGRFAGQQGADQESGGAKAKDQADDVCVRHRNSPGICLG